MIRQHTTIVAMVGFGLATLLGGCGKSAETPEEHAQRLNGERLAKIAKESGGDWDKLSDDDRTFLTSEVAHGNEQTARMLILPPNQLRHHTEGMVRR